MHQKTYTHEQQRIQHSAGVSESTPMAEMDLDTGEYNVDCMLIIHHVPNAITRHDHCLVIWPQIHLSHVRRADDCTIPKAFLEVRIPKCPAIQVRKSDASDSP